MDLNQNYQVANQPLPPPEKSNGVKIFLVILVILIILGASGYLGYKYFFIKTAPNPELTTTPTLSQLATATIEGITEKLTVELPDNFITVPIEQLQVEEQFKDTPTVFICKTKDDCNQTRFFGIVFMGENKYGDYLKAFENTKAVLEQLKSANDTFKDNQITEENINNFKLLKNEGKLSSELNLTEYYIFTNKSIFVINRTNPVGESPYAQEEFEKLVKSFKITAK